ncbi:8408_t:CDS:2, partial [Racocetra fulgida]
MKNVKFLANTKPIKLKFLLVVVITHLYLHVKFQDWFPEELKKLDLKFLLVVVITHLYLHVKFQDWFPEELKKLDVFHYLHQFYIEKNEK